jgi:hypothetical protein
MTQQPEVVIYSYGQTQNGPCVRSHTIPVTADEALALTNPFDRHQLKLPEAVQRALDKRASISDLDPSKIYLFEVHDGKTLTRFTPAASLYVADALRDGEAEKNHFVAAANEVWGRFNYATTLLSTDNHIVQGRIEAPLRMNDHVVGIDRGMLVIRDRLQQKENDVGQPVLRRFVPERPAAEAQVARPYRLAA